MAEPSQSNTAQARAKTLTSSEDRWSVNSTGAVQGLEGLYASGAGSIYTNLPGGNLSTAASAPKLDEQINKGVNFFGYGRGVENSRTSGDKRNMTQSEKASGTMNVAGAGRQQDTSKGRTGEHDFLRFQTKQKAMGQDKSQFGSDGGLAAAQSSWYTKNVHDSVHYGSAKMSALVSGRGGSTRGRTNASTLTNGTGAQSKL